MMQKSGCSVVTAAVLFERRKRMRLWMPAVLVGFLIDCLLGDPAALPRPIVLIGKGIAALERTSARLNQSQIMIETPYRNDALLADLTAICRPATRLCIAADITCPDELIRTKSIGQWQKEIKKGFVIGKRPCVFVVLAG